MPDNSIGWMLSGDDCKGTAYEVPLEALTYSRGPVLSMVLLTGTAAGRRIWSGDASQLLREFAVDCAERAEVIAEGRTTEHQDQGVLNRPWQAMRAGDWSKTWNLVQSISSRSAEVAGAKSASNAAQWATHAEPDLAAKQASWHEAWAGAWIAVADIECVPGGDMQVWQTARGAVYETIWRNIRDEQNRRLWKLLSGVIVDLARGGQKQGPAC